MQVDYFDLVVMDVKMPVMDGNTSTRLYREWEKITNSEKTPILTVSASAFDYNEKDSVEAGCDIFLTKPVGKKRLLESINKLIQNKNQLN
jgi:CheY-like chemotaxis protein